jgi:hypothetical protein
MKNAARYRHWWPSHVFLGALIGFTVAAASTRAVAGKDGLEFPSGMCAPEARLLGYSDALDKARFAGYSVSELSGLAYDPVLDRYLAVADRAGEDPSRVFTLELPLEDAELGTPTIEDVIVLRTMGGEPFTGFDLDGEGIVLHGDELLIASEGGAAPEDQPVIRRFSRAGDHLDDLPIPERFRVGSNNLSFESLALSPSGASLFTANERPLPAAGDAPADGQTADGANRIRILRYAKDERTGFVPAEQFLYLTEPDRAAGDVGLVELIALSDTELLVLERGYVPLEGNTVRLFRVSLNDAPDVSDESTLSAPGLVPLSKTLVVDIAHCPPGGAAIPVGAVQPNALLDNFEAMSLGRRLADGWQVLFLVSDDNENPTQTTRIIALAIAMGVDSQSSE